MENASYVPILKTKRAEFSAVNQLSSAVKGKIIPLFELEPVPLDPDTDTPEKTYNDQLADFGKKIATACDEISAIYLDGLLIEDQFIDLNDIYPIRNAIEQAKACGVRVVPVSSPTRSSSYLNAIDNLVNNEVCLRLTVTELANPQLISAYIARLNIPYHNIDVVIDLRDSLTEDSLASGQSYVLAAGLINNLHNLNSYRNVIISAGSFPVDLSQISVGVNSQSRFEWILWQNLRNNSMLEREVIYADYGIQHPDYTRLATRFPSVTASVRYTGDDDFWIFRGRKANQYGYEQYGAHSQSIVSHKEYSGIPFSVADSDINDYAIVYAQYQQDPTQSYKFGSPEVWRRIGQNHHITKVVNQLSNLYGL